MENSSSTTLYLYEHVKRLIRLSSFQIWLLPLMIVFLIRLPYFGLQVMNSDEGLYASVARAMQLGGIPYEDAWDHAAPGIFYLYRAVFSIFGDWNMNAVRILALIAHLGASLIIGFEFRRTHGKLYGGLAAAIVAIAIGSYLPSDVIAALTETFMLPPLLYVAVLLLRWKDDDRLNHILIGVLCAISIWFKIHALIMILSLLLGSVMARSLDKKSLIEDLISCLKILSIALVVYFILILPLLWRDGWSSYWAMYIKYNIYYMQAGKYDEFFLIGLVKTLFQWIAPNIILFALAMFGYYNLLRRSELYGKGIFLISGLVASFIIGTAGARLFGHYFIPMFALLGWGAAEGVVAIFTILFSSKMAMWIKQLLMSMIILSIIFIPTYYFHGFAYQSRIEMMKKNIKIGDKFPALVAKIQEITKSDEQIWVWGFAPEIYISAKRDCANRFINCNYLVGLVPWVNVSPEINTSSESLPNSWNLLRADLRENPPKVIIDVSVANYQFWGKYPLSSRPALQKFIRSNYTVIGIYNDFMVYKKN